MVTAVADDNGITGGENTECHEDNNLGPLARLTCDLIL